MTKWRLRPCRRTFGTHFLMTASLFNHEMQQKRPLCPQWPLCLELLQRGAVDVMPMITHRFGFSAAGVADGFDCAARSAETKAVKVAPQPFLEPLAPECARVVAAQWLTMCHSASM